MKNRTKKLSLTIATVLLLVAMLTALFTSVMSSATGEDLGDAPFFGLFDGVVNIDKTQFYDGTNVQKLPDSVKDTDEISLIIRIDNESLLEAYNDGYKSMSLKEFYLTDEAAARRADIANEARDLCTKLNENGIDYALGESYSTIFSGFEITVKAGSFLEVCNTLGSGVDVIVGEVYETEETKLVENNVNAFDTGIFDTTGFDYDGTGMVVAVLDTGTDYYHTAFSMSNFTASESNWGLTFDDVAAVIGDTTAKGFNPDLTASDVYISGKLPYGYDYADKDSDVFPINSHHGTHVAGIIAGKDDTITGVAPNAQIVTMKIFSDIEQSARTSWILAALEDCVVLGVDVINMSIGTACGFSRETDKEQINGVYDEIRALGINMVVAASNSFNSAYASEKNGNLPLTSNPDSSTVGSPSTYEGALSVASIEGAKTSYILYGSTIIYFEESTNRVSEEKEFVKELLGTDRRETEIEYVVIPGTGIEADYTGIDVKGKVALIRRGTTTFEEKANTAEKMGAAAAIVYNNVSGDIKMNVGDTKIPVCSISQNDGELLAAQKTGKIKISYNQAAGPFMSDFSSWGPTPDLGIKPEITAHGGSILSAVPGQDYDRISGTSMATPNITGVTALLRQYVMENFPASVTSDPIEVAAVINRLMMSTADIIYNKNGNPYAVRKQGAGLANLVDCANTTAYILTYDRKDGSVMDKSKIELGDDPAKTGVYTLVFTIDNFGTTSLSYDVSAIVMTEGVSETKTNQGETTVTETAYMLGAGVEITSVSGGSRSGKTVTVGAGQKAKVTVTITLTDEDKRYLDESFENGMYVEGFVTLDAPEGTVDLSVPYLAFYGDWTVAPLLDLDYFETSKDELDDSIDLFDKTLADAFATRPIGGISDDYVSYLGSFYYEQKPGSNKIAADRNHISLTNHTDGVNALRYIWAGMLRNANYVEVIITDDATGEVVYETVDRDIRKSFGDGGPIRPANIDVEFSAIEHNLKNNSKYTVTMNAYLDYGEDGGASTNKNNTFTFPITIDFQAPTLTDVEFYTEYDKSAKKNRLYAKLAVYDNHYSMAMLPGYVTLDPSTGYQMINFERYLTGINSEENSTSYVIYELTDYIDDIKESSYHKNTFAVTLYDYALNVATYEIALPAEYTDLYYEETTITLSPNQTYDLKPIVYPGTEWGELVTYESSKESVVAIVNNKLVATGSGNAQVKCTATLANGDKKTVYLSVKVLAKGDEGYKKYDTPVLESFTLDGYTVNKAFYFLSSDQRDIGENGNRMNFVGENYKLKMYPSESVTIFYDLDAYFPSRTKVVFESSNSSIVAVTESGTITAAKEGFATITAKVLLDGKSTYYSKSISIEVKDPYVISGPSLANYYGNGGIVVIPSSFGITEIGQYAFSNYDYVPKGEGDEISDESPEATKITYIGDDTIEEVIIPEGVEKIGPFAFANLTKLRKVTLPSTLTTIDYGAFYNCTSLTSIVGLENVKFINRSAFENCALSGSFSLNSAIAIADRAFFNCSLITDLKLSVNCKSVGAYAFTNDKKLTNLTIESDFLKFSPYAFANCESLTKVAINAAVIPAGTFEGCKALAEITIGKDVAVIGESAFSGTAITEFTVAEGNTTYKPGKADYILSADGSELLLVAPTKTEFTLTGSSVVSIGSGAFSGNVNLTSVNIPTVTVVGDYAFAGCTKLGTVTLGTLVHIGDHSFRGTQITAVPANTATEIGRYAFASTYISSVNIADGVIIGEGAFEECVNLSSITIGDDVKIGKGAFRFNTGRTHYTSTYYLDGEGERVYYYVYISPITSLTIGKNAEIGEAAFWFASKLESVTLGEGAVIGDYAFYTTPSLKSIDLSKVKSIGDYAFSGDILYEFTDQDCSSQAYDKDGNYLYHYYSPAFESIDLSSAESIGKDAFGYCMSLRTVTLGDGVTAIPEGAFRYATALETINLDKVTEIGEYAFNKARLSSLSLGAISSIGEYAFLECDNIISLSLGENIDSIGEGAFAYAKKLATANLGGVRVIGEYAFAYTALTSADLSGAESIGTHAFMKEKADGTEFTVKLGSSLKYIGDNPFVWCDLVPFSTVTTDSFNGKDYETTVYTFDLSDSIKVIDGSLYRVVPLGLELIYCASTDATVNVAEGTTRIGAFAFAGRESLVNVILPYTLESIGHKAFFGCDDLAIVNFTSYYAPTLEEEYDIYYFYSGENLPTLPEYDSVLGASGLGIVDYFMWNVTSDPTNVFYGASFKDYVGKVNDKIVMVRPSNGVHYDSFVFEQYFNLILDGASAADDVTLAAINAINKLPEKVSLADKAAVEAARALYNKIASREQLFLAANAYAKLTAAEKRIADLEYLANDKGDEGTEDEPDGFELDGITVLLIVTAVMAAGCGIGVLIYFILKKKNGGSTTDPDGSESEWDNDEQDDSDTPAEAVAEAEELPSPEEVAEETTEIAAGETADAEPAAEETAVDETAEDEEIVVAVDENNTNSDENSEETGEI